MERHIDLHEEAGRCLYCENAPCSAACRNGDPARALRAIRFGNERLAARWLKHCSGKDLEAAEKACIHYDQPLRLREIAASLPEAPEAGGKEPSLAIDFCGLKCENPFFLASSAVCTNYEMVADAFRAGWAGVFYKTICLQDIFEVSPRFDAVKNHDGSFASFRNMEQLSENPLEMDLDILRRLKQDFPGKIVIASIMGQHHDEWVKLARLVEEAGVDAVELNFSCPQMGIAGMGSDVGQNDELVTYYTAFVKKAVKIPVIAKMTPNISKMRRVSMAAHFAGADAISAINTIKSITLSKESEVSGKQTVSGLSGNAVKPISLRFIYDISSNKILKGVPISGIGGIETWQDALEYLQMGCSNVQVCTAIMQYGYRIIDDLQEGMRAYMQEHGISDLGSVVGSRVDDFQLPPSLDRDTVVYPKFQRESCIGCGRCYISCRDGGHQALSFGDDRTPRLNGAKCVGCHLCRLVCPTGSIALSKRVPKRQG